VPSAPTSAVQLLYGRAGPFWIVDGDIEQHFLSCRPVLARSFYASVTVGSSLLRKNAIGIQATGGASLLSYGDNHVTGNASNGSFTGSASLQ
jgi:hypothetical protein